MRTPAIVLRRLAIVTAGTWLLLRAILAVAAAILAFMSGPGIRPAGFVGALELPFEASVWLVLFVGAAVHVDLLRAREILFLRNLGIGRGAVLGTTVGTAIALEAAARLVGRLVG